MVKADHAFVGNVTETERVVFDRKTNKRMNKHTQMKKKGRKKKEEEEEEGL